MGALFVFLGVFFLLAILVKIPVGFSLGIGATATFLYAHLPVICRQFFLGDVPPPILEAMLMRYISPIRPGRKDTRKLTQKSSASFTYRVA